MFRDLLKDLHTSVKSVESCLNEKHGKEIKLLLKSLDNCENWDDLKFESQIVIERTWEKLNIGKWVDVPSAFKQTYSIAAAVKIIALLNLQDVECVKESLKVADMGVLLGYPIGNLDLTQIAKQLSEKLEKPSHEKPVILEDVPSKKIKLDNEVKTLRCPSLEQFNKEHFSKKLPVKIVEGMEHWPAMQLWPNMSYLKNTAGNRTVPIELGKTYTDASYSQKLMTISDFIENFVSKDCSEVGYLAQHQLFDQVPELKNDIIEPDYCALSENYENDSKVEVNAWFGPGGTVSPLHFDPKHNLLAQVLGTKLIKLYPESNSGFLYPHDSPLLFNTSQVDIEQPDLDLYPLFQQAKGQQCLLEAGQMLYIPPRYWHHVRALSSSFSVSFWWQ